MYVYVYIYIHIYIYGMNGSYQKNVHPTLNGLWSHITYINLTMWWKKKSLVVMMIGRYGWQIYDDIPCLISTINRACYRVLLHKDPTLFGYVWRWPPGSEHVLGGKMMIEPVDSGKIHQNPLPVQIPNPFFGPWWPKRSHFYIRLHRGSLASLSLWRSVMARSSSIVAPLLVLASVALAVPLAAHLGIPQSDEILPRLHLQKRIDPTLS